MVYFEWRMQIHFIIGNYLGLGLKVYILSNTMLSFCISHNLINEAGSFCTSKSALYFWVQYSRIVLTRAWVQLTFCFESFGMIGDGSDIFSAAKFGLCLTALSIYLITIVGTWTRHIRKYGFIKKVRNPGWLGLRSNRVGTSRISLKLMVIPRARIIVEWYIVLEFCTTQTKCLAFALSFIGIERTLKIIVYLRISSWFGEIKLISISKGCGSLVVLLRRIVEICFTS